MCAAARNKQDVTVALPWAFPSTSQGCDHERQGWQNLHPTQVDASRISAASLKRTCCFTSWVTGTVTFERPKLGSLKPTSKGEPPSLKVNVMALYTV